MGDIVMNESENIVIIGDYNCDFMVDNALQDACVSFDLHNLVTSPTCHKSCNGSLIDLCLVSKPLRFKKALNLDCWLCDFHNIVCITTKLSLPKRSPNVISYRTLKNFNDYAFVCDLFQLSEAMVYCNRDINWCMQYFSTCLYDIVNLHAPIKTKTIRQSSVPDMNSELRKLNYKKNMMRNLKNKHLSQRNYEKYRILRNKCVKVKKQSERKYFAERCDGGPKNQHFWSTIKPFVSSKYRKSDDIILEENGMIISEKEHVADIFNNYFSKIAEGLGFNDPIPNDYHDDDVLLSAIKRYDSHPSIIAIKSALKCQHSFRFAETDASDDYQILTKMNVKKSVGYDDIPCKFLKIGATPLAGILCQMVNISLNECNFPDMLKFAEIAALLKKTMIDLSKKTIDQSASSLQFRKFLSKFLEISCLLSSTRFFQNFYLASAKDIAVRPPDYG